VIDCRDFSR